jgi:hypothetical protein
MLEPVTPQRGNLFGCNLTNVLDFDIVLYRVMNAKEEPGFWVKCWLSWCHVDADRDWLETRFAIQESGLVAI